MRYVCKNGIGTNLETGIAKAIEKHKDMLSYCPVGDRVFAIVEIVKYKGKTECAEIYQYIQTDGDVTPRYFEKKVGNRTIAKKVYEIKPEKTLVESFIDFTDWFCTIKQ